MAINREKVLAELAVKRIPPDLCWGKPEEFLAAIIQALTVTLSVNENNDFVIIGHQVPSEDDKSRLWVRLARNGSFMGFYIFVGGKWQRVYNYRNDEVIWMYGDSRVIPDGFALINGTTAGIPTEVQSHIVEQYRVDTSVSGTAVVYDYFAVIYVGI